MKFIIIPALILALIFSFCLINIHIIEDYSRDLSVLISDSVKMVDDEDWRSAEHLITTAQEKHIKYRDYLFLMTHHTSIDELDLFLRLILLNIEQEDETEFLTNSESALSFLDSFSEVQQITLGNLL